MGREAWKRGVKRESRAGTERVLALQLSDLTWVILKTVFQSTVQFEVYLETGPYILSP